MKKIFVLILFALSFFVSFGQGIVPRSGPSVTVSDARFQAGLNLYVPRYTDTTAANLSKGIDSCGAQIYTYDVNWYWIRQCNPKRWTIQPTVSGSLISNVFIVDSNHIAICTINSCDTIQVNGIIGPITNVTIINNTSIRVCGSDILGSELITNGGFTGSAIGWTLGTLWAYGTNDISHSFGSTASSFQGGGLVEAGTYFVLVDVLGGANGNVVVSLDAGSSQSYNANAGSVSFTGTWNAGINSKINFAPSNDFDGNLTNVSVKQVLPNCDTLQIVPGQNFLDSIRIFVVTPLHALNDSTFYISQSGPTIRGGDSGYLSTAGYDTFLNKVDSNTHFAQNNIDFLQFVKNGVVTNWDTVHVNCYGLDEPGQVAWSGFGLGYIVNSAFYHLNCKPYISPSTLLTLAAADATLPRVDLIYVDSSGNAGVLTGVAATNPVKPQIDPFYQLELTTITVPATATVAPIDTLIVYNENIAAPTEWTPVTQVGTTIDANNTLNVYRGAKSLNVTNIGPADSITFTSSTPVDVSQYSSVVLFIQLKQAVPAASQLRLNWVNGTTFVSGSVSLSFDHNNISTFQNINVPLSLFGFTSQTVTALTFSYSAGVATPNLGFYLDFIYLQDGVGPVVPTDQTNIVAYNGLTHTKIAGIDSIRLGGTLNQNTTIATAGFTTTFTGNNTSGNNVLTATTTGNGSAIVGNATSGNGVNGIVTSGRGVYGFGSTGIGGFFESTSSFGSSSVSANGIASSFLVSPATTATVVPIFNVTSATTGTAANGIGGSIDYYIEASSGTAFVSNQLISKWTDATTATRTSQFDLTGVSNASTATIMSAHGSGVVGIGITTGYSATRFNVVDNSVGAANMVNLTSTSTAAAGNSQILLNIALSGANATSSQSTYGVKVSNTHTGTSSTNFGIDATASGGTANYGVRGTGNAVGSVGVYGVTSNGVGVSAQATNTGTGIEASSDNGGVAGRFSVADATDNVLSSIVSQRSKSGTAGAGIGSAIEFDNQTSTGVVPLANQVISKWTDATNASRTSQLLITGVNSTTTGDIISFEGNKRTKLYGRLQPQQGADVASAAGAIAVGLDGNVFELTGTNTITLISNLNWVNGSEITLVFTSTSALTNGTATSGTDITILLAGAANFTGSANDVIKLVLSEVGGTQAWREVSRSVN